MVDTCLNPDIGVDLDQSCTSLPNFEKAGPWASADGELVCIRGVNCLGLWGENNFLPVSTTLVPSEILCSRSGPNNSCVTGFDAFKRKWNLLSKYGQSKPLHLVSKTECSTLRIFTAWLSSLHNLPTSISYEPFSYLPCDDFHEPSSPATSDSNFTILSRIDTSGAKPLTKYVLNPLRHWSLTRALNGKCW